MRFSTSLASTVPQTVIDDDREHILKWRSHSLVIETIRLRQVLLDMALYNGYK